MMELCNSKLPLVFKGGLILQNLIKTETDLNTFRGTNDIDIDCGDFSITESVLVSKIREALDAIGFSSLFVACHREFGENRAAGFEIRESTADDKVLFSIDISRKHNKWVKQYYIWDNMAIIGSSTEKMAADKICAVSEKTVYRRIKDIYDLYLLSFISGIKLSKIREIMKETNRFPGEFNQFRMNIDALRHAYSEFKGIVNKPSFESIYSRTFDFCVPFITDSSANGEWCVNDGMWIEDFRDKI